MKKVNDNKPSQLVEGTRIINELSLTVEDLFQAYDNGCIDGYKKHETRKAKELKNKLTASMKKVLPYFNSFLLHLKENDVPLMYIFIKCLGTDYFDFLIAVDKKTFYNDSICRPFYEKSFKLIKESGNSFDVSFMPATENINLNGLKLDKYVMIYEFSHEH